MMIHNNSETETQGNADSHIEVLLHDIIVRLDRIEHQIDNAIYPDESYLRRDFISHVKRQKKSLEDGEGIVYSSMNGFLESLE